MTSTTGQLFDLSRLFQTEEARWRATLARDVRADGLFYYAVTTTGVYCRPICPARKPRRENARFFLSCAGAEAAGFRPCKICRPSLATQPSATGACTVRPAAILFADVVDSTRLARRLRPDEALARLAAFHTWTSALVRAHKGVVHKNLGDGFMAVFGDDESRAGDALHAVSCGVALLDELVARRAPQHGLALMAGVGVHYGMVAFGETGGARALIGETVNVASRLEHATRRLGSPLVVSDESMRAIQASHRAPLEQRLREIGVTRLPGCGPQRIWAARAIRHVDAA